MRLIQTKLRCLEGVVDTGWFVPGRETTVIYGPPGSGKSHLLQGMQALNPVYDVEAEKPFINHPKFWHQGSYRRRVIPEKKTAVFMVFAAQPDLVRELDKIDPALIETDRIQVGRRLDNSRWCTFVEISASTRWGQIVDDMKKIRSGLNRKGDSTNPALRGDFIDSRVATDRVKGDVAVGCYDWLNTISGFLGEKEKLLIDQCLNAVGRAERFTAARKTVEKWLPKTVALQRWHSIQQEYPFSQLKKEGQRFDPVMDLLRQLYRHYLSDSYATRQKLLSVYHEMVIEFQPLMPGGTALVEMTIADNSFIFHGIEVNSLLTGKIQLIALISLLATLCYGQRPLLLLDQLDNGMDKSAAGRLVNWLQGFGRYNQLILTTGSRAVMAADGWQEVKLIGTGELEEGDKVGEVISNRSFRAS